MSDEPITNDALNEAAAAPKAATTDGVEMTAQSLADLIALQKHQAANAKAKRPGRGLRFIKFIPEGPA